MCHVYTNTLHRVVFFSKHLTVFCNKMHYHCAHCAYTAWWEFKALDGAKICSQRVICLLYRSSLPCTDMRIYTLMLCGDTREIRFSFPRRTSDVEEFPMPLAKSNKMVYISGWPIWKQKSRGRRGLGWAGGGWCVARWSLGGGGEGHRRRNEARTRKSPVVV